MAFFEEPPPRKPPAPERYVEPAWRRVPREWVPTTLPLGRLVDRSEETALVL